MDQLNFNDPILLKVFSKISVQHLIFLRLVCKTWQVGIEQNVFGSITQLRLFGLKRFDEEKNVDRNWNNSECTSLLMKDLRFESIQMLTRWFGNINQLTVAGFLTCDRLKAIAIQLNDFQPTILLNQLESLTVNHFLTSDIYVALIGPELKELAIGMHSICSKLTFENILHNRPQLSKSLIRLTLNLSKDGFRGVSAGVLEFICDNFEVIQFLDIQVDEGLDIKDIAPKLAKLANLKELHLRSNNDIFAPFDYDSDDSTDEEEDPQEGNKLIIFPNLKILHLYIQFQFDAFEKIARMFPNIDELLVNQRAIECNCEGWFKRPKSAGLCLECRDDHLSQHLKDLFVNLKKPILVDIAFMISEHYFSDSDDSYDSD